MLVLITYDVNTETAARACASQEGCQAVCKLRKTRTEFCFECIVDNAQCIMLKSLLADIIDVSVDSLRFYYLGNKYATKVEQIGVDKGIAADDVLIV